jgi:hypothetical protein
VAERMRGPPRAPGETVGKRWLKHGQALKMEAGRELVGLPLSSLSHCDLGTMTATLSIPGFMQIRKKTWQCPVSSTPTMARRSGGWGGPMGSASHLLP